VSSGVTMGLVGRGTPPPRASPFAAAAAMVFLSLERRLRAWAWSGDGESPVGVRGEAAGRHGAAA
jgi:hypothetical protein